MDHFYGIYGVGAVLILVTASYFSKNNVTLFLGGYAIGTITEYLTSFLVEIILHAKWWDYTNNIFNVNGRVCLLYSAFWGILTIFLVKKFNPLLDKILDKIKEIFNNNKERYGYRRIRENNRNSYYYIFSL